MTLKVIDVSYYNQIIDWEKVKKAVDAVIIRLGYRGCTSGKIVIDQKAEEYIRACQEHGIPFSIYFFPTSITEQEAREEAQWVLAQIDRLHIEPCLPIYADSEKVTGTGRSDNISKSLRTKCLNAFMSVIRDAGYRYGVYASTYWYKDCLNDGELLQGCSRWVAQYASKCTYTGKIDMWQYTSHEKVPAVYINGDNRCDASHCYINLDTAKNPVKADLSQRQAVIDIFTGWSGKSENNGGHREIIDIYNKYLSTAVKFGTMNYRVQYSDAWCATATSAAFIKAGLAGLFPIECSCTRQIELAKKMGIWIENDNTVPEPCWAVMYDWQDSGAGDNTGVSDHTGLVVSVDKGAGRFRVIEGNKEDAVGYRIMTIGGRYIRGFIAPKFNDKYEPIKVSTEYRKPSKTGKYWATVATQHDPLNVRQGPGTEYGLCTTFGPIPKGSTVMVCDELTANDGSTWCYVLWAGKYGFCSKKYLRESRAF